MVSTAQDEPDRVWRLIWTDRTEPVIGIGGDAGGIVTAWMESKRPDDIKRFASDQNWEPDRCITVECAEDGHSEQSQTTVARLDAWDPRLAKLPEGGVTPEPEDRSPIEIRADLVGSLDRYGAEAVKLGLLLPKDFYGLLLHLDDALEGARAVNQRNAIIPPPPG